MLKVFKLMVSIYHSTSQSDDAEPRRLKNAEKSSKYGAYAEPLFLSRIRVKYSYARRKDVEDFYIENFAKVSSKNVEIRS